jgi:triacylglycerol esterase/lipase EstA (alpha/beta hydrolase family)
MRKRALCFIVLLVMLTTQAFALAQQTAETKIIVLNRANQPTTQIIDGDSIQLQITLPQSAAQQQNIDFLFDDTTVGACLIPSGGTTCKTDAFPSLGWHWNIQGDPQDAALIQAADDRGTVIAQTNIAIKPRPVVLVHGFLSNPQTWTPYVQSNGFLDSLGLKGFAVGDGQFPGALNTGSFAAPTSRTNTLAQNAEILGEYISNVKKQTGAEMVDLVVHSMGGMISRYYIDRLMKTRDVAQLIMLGSPMGGSDCSVLPASLGFFLPASIEIRESYMRGVFNQQITHRKGIEFYNLGGTAIQDAFKSPCTDIPNDTVVAFDSINAIPLQSSKIDDIHSDLTFSKKIFTDFVKPLLQKSASSFIFQPDPVPLAPPESPLEFTRVYTGHVDAGGSTELTINIEPNIAVASFALYDASRSVTTVVRGASGNIIQLSPETNGFIKVDDPSTMLYLGYGFQNPKPGLWKVTVQASETTPANGTDFAISVYFVGGAKLTTASSTLVPRLNEKVNLTASVSLNGQPLQITQAQAVIRNPEGKTETINFPAGQTISATWTPRDVGTHAVDIVITALAPDGSSIERTAFLAVEAQRSFSKFQLSLNLLLLMALILLVVFGILFGLFRLIRRARR